MNQEHIRQQDADRKVKGRKALKNKRKCNQQMQLEEHVLKVIRRGEQLDDSVETVASSLLQLGTLPHAGG